MGYSALTLPHQFMAAYSAIPFKVFDTDYNQVQQYQYIVNAVYDTVNINAADPYTYQSNVYMKLTSSTANSFNLGDTILLDDSINSNLQTGYYNIVLIVSPTEFVIDLFPGVLPVLFTLKASRFFKWKLSPDTNGYGKLDMSNVMKDLVSQNLTGETVDYALNYEGPDTKKCFGILAGYQSQYVFEFEDNIFSGTVGFHNSTLMSLSGVPFAVGDVIQIAQNPVAWGYTGITSSGVANKAQYNSNQQHSFLTGQPIQVAGQTSITFYNGQTSVLTPISSTSLSTYQTFQGNSVQSGYIYGIPRPTYNTTATITALFVDPIYGVIVLTDIAWAGSSVPISGTIKFTGNQLQQNLNSYSDYDLFCIYNAHINRPDYSITAFDKYVVQNRSFSGNNLSTILTQPNQYRIERSTIGWLLEHSFPASVMDGVIFKFYNSNGTLLGSVLSTKQPSSLEDVYYPIGLEQIAGSSYTNSSGVFSGYSGQVNSYCVSGYDAPFGTPNQRTKEICFKINQDCSMYEVYHLMWKDQYGSFISYPFIYISRDYIESEKKTYYQQEGKWDDNTFDYDDYGVGEKVFYERSRQSLTLNSGWLYEFERDLINDLVQSPSVYIQTPDNRLFSCHLDQPKTEIYKNINEQLFSYTFNVRVSNNEFRF